MRILTCTVGDQRLDVPALNFRLASRHKDALKLLGTVAARDDGTSEAEASALASLVADDLARVPGQDHVTADWLLDNATPYELGKLLGTIAQLASYGDPDPQTPSLMK
jgi:hypothetical protein